MKRIATLLGVLACFVTATVAWAGDKSDTVKLGVLTDMTGVFSDLTGNGSVEAAKMAIAKFGGKVNGKPIELVYADHQNKADVGLGILRRWYSVDDVDAVFARAVAAGGKAIRPVADQFYGDRGGGISDPFGHSWWIATHKEDVSPEEMQKRMQAMG